MSPFVRYGLGLVDDDYFYLFYSGVMCIPQVYVLSNCSSFSWYIRCDAREVEIKVN